MKKPSAKFIADGLAALAKALPPPHPRYAEITIELVEPVRVVVLMTPLRLERLRALFPELSDSEIVNELVSALFDRYGVED